MGGLKQFAYFLVDLWHSRNIVFELAKRDFEVRYLGSFLGVLWAFVHPMVTILIFWFVFQVGFKSMPVDDFPFILWLISGMVPWFFISECIANGTNAILENGFLVKKVVFRLSILPVVKIMSALFIHLFFILIVFSLFLLYGYKPNIYNVQVIYYLISSIILILGLTWISSSTVVFFKDMNQIVSMFLQFGFWLTPIFWSLNTVPEKYHWLLKLNPFYYIIKGYRDTFVYHKWFWEDMSLTVWFWVVALGSFVLGAIIFRKLRPHFADVL